jgi:hypothetical protein
MIFRLEMFFLTRSDAVKSPPLARLIDAERGGRVMKRSRRVVLTMMGSAAVGAATMGFVPYRDCGPGRYAVRSIDGRFVCHATYGGFGGTLHHFHGHAQGHGHGHGG